MEYRQQGDCLVYNIDKLPEGVTPIKGTTVAYGEVTGHHHSFYDDVIALPNKFEGGNNHSKNVKLYEAEDKSLFAEILAPVFLKHNEHKPIEFKPGIYRIGIVQEYDHVEKLARKVVD